MIKADTAVPHPVCLERGAAMLICPRPCNADGRLLQRTTNATISSHAVPFLIFRNYFNTDEIIYLYIYLN